MRRIQHVDVNRNVDIGIADAFLELLYDPIDADMIDISRSYDLEPTSLVILPVIPFIYRWGSDSCVS
jgi:hypothetical protein